MATRAPPPSEQLLLAMVAYSPVAIRSPVSFPFLFLDGKRRRDDDKDNDDDADSI